MTRIITLKDFDDPSFFGSSTAVLAFPTPGGNANSFSFPPILYYATKAKKLSAQKIENESESLYVNISRDTIGHIRTKARAVYTDLMTKVEGEHSQISCFIQHRLLAFILGEKETYHDFDFSSQSISINASRSNKNVTIPPYLFNRLVSFMGSEKGARLLIHQTVFDILNKLKTSGFTKTVVTKKENGQEVQSQQLIGDAANSSWSRKLHNNLILRLIENSSIDEVSASPSIFDVKMIYEPRFEI